MFFAVGQLFQADANEILVRIRRRTQQITNLAEKSTGVIKNVANDRQRGVRQVFQLLPIEFARFRRVEIDFFRWRDVGNSQRTLKNGVDLIDVRPRGQDDQT